MSYGLGAFLLAAGLVLALAVRDSIDAVDLTTVGWILAAVGLVLVVLTALTAGRGRRVRSSRTTTHPDGSQTVRESRGGV